MRVFAQTVTFACASHGAIFDVAINKHFEKFHLILTCRLSGKH